MKDQTLSTLNRAIWSLTEWPALPKAAAKAIAELHQETTGGKHYIVNETRARPLAVKHLGVGRLQRMLGHVKEKIEESTDTSANAMLRSALGGTKKPRRDQLEKVRVMETRLEKIISCVEGQVLSTLTLDYSEHPRRADGLHEERAF